MERRGLSGGRDVSTLLDTSMIFPSPEKEIQYWLILCLFPRGEGDPATLVLFVL